MITSSELSSPSDLAAQVAVDLGGYRHRGAHEKDIQDSVERVLANGGWVFHREHSLSPADRPDFLVSGGLVVEVKMKASRSFVLMQLGRYAVHNEVKALLLASPRYTVVAGLPSALYGKPLVGVHLPGAGLA